MTADQLRQIMPHSGARADIYAFPLTAAMDEFDIISVRRVVRFLAQIAHESGSLRYVRELASGDAYEGRGDLGNVKPGDGVRFKGRGLIQITGRANYMECGAALDLDLVTTPEILEQPLPACRSAAWFWQSRGLNALADAGEFKRITMRINGGLNGYADRLAHLERAIKVLGDG